MREKPHVPLWARFVLIASLNLAILAIVFAVFVRMQLEPELESFLMAQTRAKIGSVTALVAEDLQRAGAPDWSALLDRYSREHGITLLLYRNTGQQLAGPSRPLPLEVDALMPRGGPPPPRGGPPRPPPPNDPGPPSGDRGTGPPNQPQSFPYGPPFLAVADSEPKYWVGVRMPIIGMPDGEPLRSVLMFVSPSFFTNPFFFEIRPWLAIAAAAGILSALCWLPFVRNLTRSIADMMRATARIAEGRFDVALKLRRHDELGLLGGSINQMAGKLESFTDGRKRFLGAAAHELRSPIARMQLAAEIIARNSDTAAQKYVDALRDDIAMMSRLTDELLQFARAESPGPVELEPTNVADAIRTATRREADDSGAVLRVDVDPSLSVRANMEYLVRSLSNVLRNALRYAGDSGPIHVSAKRKHDWIEVCVSDSGPGLPEDALDKIFTPFYRLDDARDRRTGGTGLGLAIVRTCIEACGGTVECRNRRPSGLEVWIRLPEA